MVNYFCRIRLLCISSLLFFLSCTPHTEAQHQQYSDYEYETISEIQEDLKWSERMARSIIKRNPNPMTIDFRTEPKWEYTTGLVLKSIEMVWRETGDDSYLEYIDAYYDMMISEDGSVLTYDTGNFNIDRINPGRLLFNLHDVYGTEKYMKVIERLRYHLKWQPRTTEGGFWHKLIYPWQKWLDGAYMGPTFYAEYAMRFNEPESFDDVALQLIMMEQKTRDEETGLLYHGWDESRVQRWADPETGLSSNFWGRAMGWYAMAIVEVLDYLPEDHKDRDEIIAILNRLMEAAVRYQDEETGLWYQVVDEAGRDGNYLESSVSTMFTYAMAKGANMGYLDERYLDIANNVFDSILSEFIEVDEDGEVHIHQACSVAGLGGNPYRDGSYEYYISEPIRTNDTKATGPFIKAALELDR
jgi:unsaturated rhamnogalacturonyl hydrolase